MGRSLATRGLGNEPSRLAIRIARPRASRRGRWLAWLAAAGLLGLILAGWQLHASVERMLGELVANGLQTVLAANRQALELWLDREQDLVAGLVAGGEIGTTAEALLAASLAQEPAATLADRAEARSLRAELLPLLGDDQASGYLLLDAGGRIAAADRPELVGQRVDAEVLELLGQGLSAPLVSRPLRLSWTDRAANQLHLLAMAPVPGATAGVLALLLDAGGDFSRVLGVGRLAGTSLTFAFDREGRLLSKLRDEDAAIPAVQIRDPGTSPQAADPQAAQPQAAWPLTRMAAAAIAGGQGVDVQGYRDFRGIEVVGAWVWLERWRMGLATEVPRATALAVLRPLTIVLWGLSILAALVPLLGLPCLFLLRRLRRRVAEVERLGQYRLLRKLGEGGMGVVFEVEHALLRRRAALKMLRPEAMGEEALTRFEREVRLTARLVHPNAVTVFDFGRSADGRFYYVMELLSGVDLAQVLARDGAQPPARVIHILRHVCAALREAHGLGLVHRDIKPPNIMLCRQGGEYDLVKLLDFGLVQELDDPVDHRLTTLALLSGTPAYIAPERLRDPLVGDQRVDIYALGAVAFNLLTGRDVFEGRSGADIVLKAATEPAPAAAAVAAQPIPGALDALVTACLAKQPEARPATVDAMLAVLEPLALEHPWTRGDAMRWWSGRDEPAEVRAEAAPETMTIAAAAHGA